MSSHLFPTKKSEAARRPLDCLVVRPAETSYKAESPGKSAQHDKALDSGDKVNAGARLLDGVALKRPLPTRLQYMSMRK